MTTYNAPNDVFGEFATTDGLVSFEYLAGEIMPAGDQAVLDHLVSLGLMQVAVAKSSKKTTIEPAAPSADAQEEK